MANKLYYGSLEKHMKEYMKGVDLQNQNNLYQLAQAQIVKEGEAMQLSRAEIQNKIEMMKQSLKENIAQKLLPEKVAQVAQVAQDQYKPMTASEYEQNLIDRYKKTGVLISGFPEVPIYQTKEQRKQRVDNILSLYKNKTLPERAPPLLDEILRVAIEKQKAFNLNKTQFNNEIKKNFNEISKNPKVSDALQDELLRSLNNLKPIPSIPIKVKKVSPFQQELTQKLDERTRVKKILPEQLSMSNITTEETKAKAKARRKKPIASIVSDATTVSDSTTVNPSGSPRDDPIDPIEQKTTGDNMTIKKEIVDRYKTLNMDVPEELTKRGGVKDEILKKYTKILNRLESERMAASGLRKRKSKKNK